MALWQLRRTMDRDISFGQASRTLEYLAILYRDGEYYQALWFRWLPEPGSLELPDGITKARMLASATVRAQEWQRGGQHDRPATPSDGVPLEMGPIEHSIEPLLPTHRDTLAEWSDWKASDLRRYVMTALLEADEKSSDLNDALNRCLEDAKVTAAQDEQLRRWIVDEGMARAETTVNGMGRYNQFILLALTEQGRQWANLNPYTDSSEIGRSAATMENEAMQDSGSDSSRRVFISHASADKDLGKAVVDHLLRLGLDLPEDRIFFSSRLRNGIRGGESWFDRIKQELGARPFTISLLTDSFHQSDFSFMETGAAWIAGDLVILRYDTKRGVLQPLQIYDIDSEEALDEFGKQAAQALDLDLDIARWNEARSSFIARLPSIQLTAPAPDSDEGALAVSTFEPAAEKDAVAARAAEASAMAQDRTLGAVQSIHEDWKRDPTAANLRRFATEGSKFGLGQLQYMVEVSASLSFLVNVYLGDTYPLFTVKSTTLRRPSHVRWNEEDSLGDLATNLETALASGGVHPGPAQWDFEAFVLKVGEGAENCIRKRFGHS